MADFEYRIDGFFVTLHSQNDQAVAQWLILAASQRGAHGKVLLSHWKGIKMQFEKCGYTLHKAKKSAPSTAADDDCLLAELFQK